MIGNPFKISIIFTLIIIMISCSSNRNLMVSDVEQDQNLKLYFQNGTNDQVYVTNIDGQQLTYVSVTDHEEHSIDFQNIRRVEKLNRYYDIKGNPISDAEIEKFKTSKNTWGYGLGGLVIGGAGGLVLGLPFWFAEIGDIPPYFTAGAGAIAGSIYFALQGQEKDKRIAIEKIRYLREREYQLQEQLAQEKNRLQQLQDTTEQLREKLKNKDEKEK